MLAYLLKRLGVAILVALTVSVVTFSMIYLSGDPALAPRGRERDGGGHREHPPVLRV